jgi:uncharacterized protein YqeY
MNLFDTVSNDIKAAMLAKDKIRLEALRGAKKEFLEAKTAKGADGDLADETAVKILQKMVKQRKDSAAIYIEQNRPELAEKEQAEVAVLENYLPQQLSPEALEAQLKAIITQVGATSAKDMGKVMGVATQSLAGKTEGRLIAEKVKQLLGG